MNTTHRLHAFYVRVGAAIPLTSTVPVPIKRSSSPGIGRRGNQTIGPQCVRVATAFLFALICE